MHQEKVLEYAQQYLSDKMEKMRANLDSENLSPFQKGKFQMKLERYTSEYEQVTEMLKEFD
jgi:viroplasmin and RNaseH domain-containing protein